MTNTVKPGDTVRYLPQNDLGIGTVTEPPENNPFYGGEAEELVWCWWANYKDTQQTPWWADPTNLELVAQADEPQPGSVAPTTEQHSVIFTPEVLSDFDGARGDQRKFDRDEAFRLAVQRTYERECPQAIYRGGPALLGGEGMWVVRDAQVRS